MNKLINLSRYASFACFVHCMTFPLLVAILPAIGLGFFLNHTSELIMMSIAIVSSVITLCWGFKQHKNIYPIALFIASLMWYKIGHMNHHNLLFLFTGMSCFICSNILNKKLCYNCHSCKEN